METTMRRSLAAKVLAAVALVAATLLVPMAGTSGAAPSVCNGYTATTLAVSPTTVAAGGGVTLSGQGVPFETVSATLLSTPSASLGSGLVGFGGAFSFGATIPGSTAPGTYIIQGTSTSCSSFTVSITVTAPPPLVLAATTTTAAPPTTAAPTTTTAAPTTTSPSAVVSSCSASVAGRTFIPGQGVVWTLDTSGFDPSRQVRLRLRSSSSTTTLYGIAAWPSGNQTTVTIPVGAAPGSYMMEQTGYTTAGKITTSNCPVTVSSTPAAAAAQGESGPAVPLGAIAIGALTVFGLVQLRLRRMRRATA